MKKTRVAIVNNFHGYWDQSLFPRVLRSQSSRALELSSVDQCDLLVVGPYLDSRKWEALRRYLGRIRHGRIYPPLTVFHTGENVRASAIGWDFALTFDTNVSSTRHLRWPLWKDVLDWQGEGLIHSDYTNPRFGRLLPVDRLLDSLGRSFIRKPFRSAIFASHLGSERRRLAELVANVMPVDGYGAAFQPEIAHHDRSGLTKLSVLQGYGFSLCPENGIWPGYHTEKIPEAFCADTLPITWVSSAVNVDFNPGAFVNLLTLDGSSDALARELIADKLDTYAQAPLLHERPQLAPLRRFADAVLDAI